MYYPGPSLFYLFKERLILMLYRSTFAIILIAYAGLFSIVDKRNMQEATSLQYPWPTAILEISGPLKSIIADSMYIHLTTYLGDGDMSEQVQRRNPQSIAYFDAITTLHPYLRDTYYMAASTLPWVSPENTRTTNQLLMRSKPLWKPQEEWMLPFFIGFNHFYFLNEPIKASNYIYEASQVSQGLTWLSHLASTLAAQGGNVRTALFWLNAMYKIEDNKEIRQRYAKEIIIFKKAVSIQEAVNLYFTKYHHYPSSLALLVPEFIKEVPKKIDNYILHYHSPNVSLNKRSQHAR